MLWCLVGKKALGLSCKQNVFCNGTLLHHFTDIHFLTLLCSVSKHYPLHHNSSSDIPISVVYQNNSFLHDTSVFTGCMNWLGVDMYCIDMYCIDVYCIDVYCIAPLKSNSPPVTSRQLHSLGFTCHLLWHIMALHLQHSIASYWHHLSRYLDYNFLVHT